MPRTTRATPTVVRTAFVAFVAFVAFGGAPAIAQVEDPPEEPETEVAREGGAGKRDDVSWLALAGGAAIVLVGAWVATRRRPGRGVGATAPILAVPERRVVALDRARVARHGGEHEVVARVAPEGGGPVYEVVWRFDGERSGFELASLDDAGRVLDVPRSPATAWRVGGPPPRVGSLRTVHEAFCRMLADAGWEPAGTGDAWFAQRFRAPARGRSIAASTTPTTRRMR